VSQYLLCMHVLTQVIDHLLITHHLQSCFSLHKQIVSASEQVELHYSWCIAQSSSLTCIHSHILLCSLMLKGMKMHQKISVIASNHDLPGAKANMHAMRLCSALETLKEFMADGCIVSTDRVCTQTASISTAGYQFLHYIQMTLACTCMKSCSLQP